MFWNSISRSQRNTSYFEKHYNIQKKKSEFLQLRYTFTNEIRNVYHRPFTDYWISLKYMLCFSLNFLHMILYFYYVQMHLYWGFYWNIILNINKTKFECFLSPDDLLNDVSVLYQNITFENLPIQLWFTTVQDLFQESNYQ